MPIAQLRKVGTYRVACNGWNSSTSIFIGRNLQKKLVKGLLPGRHPGSQMYGALLTVMKIALWWKTMLLAVATGSCGLGGGARPQTCFAPLPSPTPVTCELIFVHSRGLVSVLQQFSSCCLRHISANVGTNRIRASL